MHLTTNAADSMATACGTKKTLSVAGKGRRPGLKPTHCEGEAMKTGADCQNCELQSERNMIQDPKGIRKKATQSDIHGHAFTISRVLDVDVLDDSRSTRFGKQHCPVRQHCGVCLTSELKILSHAGRQKPIRYLVVSPVVGLEARRARKSPNCMSPSRLARRRSPGSTLISLTMYISTTKLHYVVACEAGGLA